MKLAYLYKIENEKIVIVDSGSFYDIRDKYKAIRGGLEHVDTEDGIIYFNAARNYSKKVRVGTPAPVEVQEPIIAPAQEAPKADVKAKARPKKKKK